MSSKDFAIEVSNLSKRYEIYDSPSDRLKQFIFPKAKRIFSKASSQYFRDFWALKDVSFHVKKGETVGIIGKNGSGKSTLLQLICGTLTPTSGSVKTVGRIAALLELGSGFNPDFTGRENVYLNGAVLGLSKKEIEDRFEKIEQFADIGEFIDQPVKTYSSGMYVRLAFAVQVHIDAAIVIIDEALAVGDIFFQQKCYARLEELRNSGAAILFVSHGMNTVEQFCDRAVYLDHGKTIFIGPAVEATKLYYLKNQPTLSAPDSSMAASSDSLLESTKGSELKSEDSFWPGESLLQSADGLSQINNGFGELLHFAVLDSNGNSSRNFQQGEKAFFYYEFKLLKSIETPIVGTVLQNSRGANVHGKSSLEYGALAPNFLTAGSVIRCCQVINMSLEVGEYSFEIGLASMSSINYENRNSMGHDELYSKVMRISHTPNAGILSVSLRQNYEGSQLLHHGIADLPGSLEFVSAT
jgi:lipopolysaccharide transport system ATP-binding protein